MIRKKMKWGSWLEKRQEKKEVKSSTAPNTPAQTPESTPRPRSHSMPPLPIVDIDCNIEGEPSTRRDTLKTFQRFIKEGTKTPEDPSPRVMVTKVTKERRNSYTFVADDGDLVITFYHEKLI